MAYTFKLSRRLAQLYYPAALLGAALAACRVSDITTSDPATPRVASLEISPSTLTLNAGDSGQLTAIVRDAAGHAVTGAITWASSDSAVALVDQSGLVTGRAEGTVDVTASSQGTSGTGSVRVSRAPVASVQVSPAAAGISLGQAVRLTAIIRDKTGKVLTGRSVSWISSDTAVAPVSDSGLVTGRGAGSATITGTSDGKSGSSAVTVTVQSVASVTVTPASASVVLGQTVQLAATPRDARGNPMTGQTVTWTSSAPAVASVNGSGLVSGVGAGSATITATSGGVAGPAAVTVTAATPVAVAGVGASGYQDPNLPQNTMDADLATRWSAQGDGQWIGYDLGQLTAIGPVDIAWYRGNEWAAAFDIQVSADGATWATAFSGRSGGQSLALERYTFPAATGRYLRIVGHGQWSGTTQLSLWTSITEVTAYGSPAGNGPTPVVGTLTLTTASASVTVGQTVQLAATPKDILGNPLAGRTVTWSSSAPSVATVSSSGLVSGVAMGSATISATSGGVAATAVLTVTADPGTGTGPQPGANDTIIFQDGFESGSLSQWTQDPATGRYSISTDSGRVKSGTGSLQVLFTPTNTYGIITRWFMPGYDEIYVKFDVLFEEGFDESNGLHFLAVAGNRIDDPYSSWGKPAIVPNGTDFFYASVDPEFVSGDATLKPLHFYTYWPDMTCCYGNRFYQTSPKTALVPGQWQQVVFHVKLNTPGQYDGSQELWINGVKQISVQNLRWRTTTDLRLNEIRFDDWMSQGPKTEHLWIDNVTVWRP